MSDRPATLPSSDRGFTLIELLVVVAIIGILSAIGIPQYAEFRRRGFDARSIEELRNASTAQEAYFTVHFEYADCVGGPACAAVLPEFRPSEGVDIVMQRVPAAGGIPEHFTGRAFHPDGTRNNAINAFEWHSLRGGLQ